MNEIEKLYKNVGIEPIVRDNAIGRGYYIEHQRVEEYPPFTAEKQIELIKFLLDKYCDIRIRKNLEGDYYIKSFNDISCFSEDFEETLASFTNTHLQDLTAAEQNEIREILKWKYMKWYYLDLL